MTTYPLESITLEEAKRKQFKLIDIITKKFRGSEILTRGDLGVVKGLNKPRITKKVEEIIADFFGAEKAVLVRGAGTAAIKWGLYSILKNSKTRRVSRITKKVEEIIADFFGAEKAVLVRGAGTAAIKWGLYSILKNSKTRRVLVHKAPIYPTTLVSLQMLNANILEVDYNNLEELKKILEDEKIDVAIVQYTRQKIDDSYKIEEVIERIKEYKVPILTDDNYVVMKVKNIGVELGANLSAFSTFKLLGPEGIGCLVGNEKYIYQVVDSNYSGGGQVQGHEALDVLRGMVYAPVSLAIQGEVNDELIKILNNERLSFIKNAYLVNAQSKVIIVEFKENIAEEILIYSEKLGALPNPVGAESKYEFSPLFYRVSGTFRKMDPTLEKRMIRINPNRAGTETIIRILEESYKGVKGE